MLSMHTTSTEGKEWKKRVRHRKEAYTTNIKLFTISVGSSVTGCLENTISKYKFNKFIIKFGFINRDLKCAWG